MFKYIVLLTSLILASVAAYYSVFGLSHLFAGAFYAVVIMASTIELAKLISASLLKNYWNKLSNFIKVYLLIGTVSIMILTSAGIYGFLTSAYQNTINAKSVSDVLIQNAEFKKNTFLSQIQSEQSNIDRLQNRINSLNDIRINQEVRLDTLYQRRQISTAKRVENEINKATAEIQEANNLIQSSNNIIKQYNDSIINYEIKIVEYKTNDVAAELGPLIYISELTGLEMNVIINYFVLLIIFVFDPMAIILLVSFNIIRDIENEKSELQDLEHLNEQYEDEDEEYEGFKNEHLTEDLENSNDESAEEIVEKLQNDLSGSGVTDPPISSSNVPLNLKLEHRDIKRPYSNAGSEVRAK